MLFTTTTQYVALAVALIAGWLFGLASHPGGKKWKQRYADERAVHAANRRDYDARLAELSSRNKELENENVRLAKAVPVAQPVAATPIVERGRSAAIPARAVRTPGERRGWFDWNTRTGPTA